MVNNQFINIFNIIYLFINLLILTRAEILNNPLLMTISSNPFIFNAKDEIHFYFPNKKYTQNPATREISSQQDFCSISEVNTLIKNEVTNKYYIYSQSSHYLISLPDNNCQSNEITNTDLFPDVQYIGNIFEGEFNPNEFYIVNIDQSKTNLRCNQAVNEIIIYGKKENDIGFYFVEKKLMVDLNINCDIEDFFYCKKIDNSVYVCVYIFCLYYTRSKFSWGLPNAKYFK